MAVSFNQQPPSTEWVTINGVDVNLAQVASITFAPQTGLPQGGTLAVVHLTSYNPHYTEGENVTWFEIRDTTTLAALRTYVDNRRPRL